MGLSKYQKGDFISSTVAFYQKTIFDFLNPLQIYQVILIYGIFSVSFLDNLNDFFNKNMVAEKNNFSSNA